MRRVLAALLGTVLLGACASGTGTPPPAPVHAGRVAAPTRPLLPRPVPSGAVVTEVRSVSIRGQALQTLYLPDGSTPEHGPALAVGHFSQEAGSVLCGRGRTLDDPGAAFTGLTRIIRSGRLIAIEGEISTDEPGYVIGRDLTETQVRLAARELVVTGLRSRVRKLGLPAGFRRRASAPVIPLSTFMPGLRVGLRLGTRTTALVMQSDLDRQARTVFDFWRATVARASCRYGVPTLVARDDTVAVVTATNRTDQRRVARSLRPSTTTALRRARRDATHPTEATVAAECGEHAIVLTGKQGDYTWVVALDLSGSRVCTAIDKGGQSYGPGISSGSFAAAAVPPGSIELLDRGSLNEAGVIAGRVGTDVATVTVTPDGGVAQPGRLVDVPADPTHHYWVLFSAPSPPFGRIVVTASDAAGTPIATLASPP